MPGGCTVLVALFILGKLYVANAGDSRAVLTRYRLTWLLDVGCPTSSDSPTACFHQVEPRLPHVLRLHACVRATTVTGEFLSLSGTLPKLCIFLFSSLSLLSLPLFLCPSSSAPVFSQTLGRLAPHLLGPEYGWLEYVRRPTRRDVGSRMLYR